jgi:hypothetical protein
VAEHGRNANYVRNLQVNPSVRIKIGRALAHCPRRQIMPEPGVAIRSTHGPQRVARRPIGRLAVVTDRDTD